MRPLSYRDVESLLRKLGNSTSRIVLVGGQAVNFWAERYLDRVSELHLHGPYSSKDIDFCGTRAALIECARQLGGKALLPEPFEPTPNAGQLLFLDDTGTERVIDFLVHPFGLDAEDVLKTSLPVEVLDEGGLPTGARFRVMHPERCLESRVYNIGGLPGYDSPRALAQATAAILCTREFQKDLLSSGHIRPVLTIAERVFRLCHDNLHGRSAFERHGIDPFSAIFTDVRLPAEFNEVRYPQMLERLALRRNRRRTVS
ncbi:MAG: hypothetical protein U0441_15775 [Polyangiaceae bacterium]